MLNILYFLWWLFRVIGRFYFSKIISIEFNADTVNTLEGDFFAKENLNLLSYRALYNISHCAKSDTE